MIKSIDCVCCGKKIEMIDDYHESNKDHNPSTEMWKNGYVSILSIGYGSVFDGYTFFVGMCDECIESKSNSGTLIFHKYIWNDIDGSVSEFYKKIQNRKSNLDKLID